MMKSIRKLGVYVLLGLVFCSAAWAMDYARMTNQELADLRGAIQNAPEAEQEIFETEWEKRLAVMTEEEKKLYTPPPEDPPGTEEKLKNPFVQGKGYNDQGGGSIIYGGGGPLPGGEPVGGR